MTPSGDHPEDVRQVLRNAGYLLVAYVLPRVFTVVSIVVAARWLGAERFGAYGAAAALAVITSVLAGLGMLPLLVREIAQAPERAPALLAGALRLKLLTGAAMLTATWLVSGTLFGDQPEARAATMVLALGWALHAFAENAAAYYQAVERMTRWTQSSAIFGIVSALVGIVLLALTGSVVAYSVGFIAGWGAALAWLVRGLPAGVRGGSPVAGQTRALLRQVAPFAGASVGLAIYSKVDVLLLQAWSTPPQVGLYTAAYKSIDIFQALVIVAAGAVYPRLSRAAARAGGGARAARASTEVLLLGAVPFAMTLFLLSGPVVALLFGAGYAGASPVLAKLALLMPMLSVTIMGGYVLGAAGRMLPVAGAYAGASAINVALNAWLVPTLGAEGAALARLASEALLLVAIVALLRGGVAAAPRLRVALLAAAAVALGAVLALVPDPTGGLLRAAAFLVAAPCLFAIARVAGFGDLLALARAGRANPSPSRRGAA